jgi:hypothetical protein
MRFGANYTPSQGWFHSWHAPDLDAIRRDFDSLAALGLDHVRVLPLWEVLQPNRTLVREQAVDDVVAVVDAAHEAGLDASVDVLQGHLSSYDFLPSWVLSWHARNIFTDPDVVEAQAILVRTLGHALAGRPGFLGLTVGNETNQFARFDHPARHPVTSSQASSWLSHLLEVASAAAPHTPHAHSFDDDVWFGDTSAFTPEHAVTHGDVTTVHSWVFTGVARHFPPGHPAFAWFARYLLELAAAWATASGSPSRPVWLQEVGAPTPHLGAGGIVPFAQDTLANAVTHPGLWGITWWCSHDVDRSLADYPELEYSLGLLTSDRQVKPLGAAVRDAIPRLRELAAPPTTPAGRPTLGVPVTDEGAVLRSDTGPASRLFAQWVEAAEAGTPPRLTLPAGARSVVVPVDPTAATGA